METRLPGTLVYAGFTPDSEHEYMIRHLNLRGGQHGYDVYRSGVLVLQTGSANTAYAKLREVGAFPPARESGPRGD